MWAGTVEGEVAQDAAFTDGDTNQAPIRFEEIRADAARLLGERHHSSLDVALLPDELEHQLVRRREPVLRLETPLHRVAIVERRFGRPCWTDAVNALAPVLIAEGECSLVSCVQLPRQSSVVVGPLTISAPGLPAQIRNEPIDVRQERVDVVVLVRLDLSDQPADAPVKPQGIAADWSPKT